MSLSNHTLILKNDGTLWGCGYNGYGQLGLGDTNDRIMLTQITVNVDNVKSVYCGNGHTFILKNDGTLWGCGRNEYGQLGLGDTSKKTTFTKITTNADNIKSVYCGYGHTIILKNDGTLWTCGYNNCGQLGLGDKNNRTTFTIIDSNPGNIKSICCGFNYTLILQNDSTLWGCGNNSEGEFGIDNITVKTTFTKITDDIKSVCCGDAHTIILKNDGTLYGSGYNKDGELGLGDNTNRATFTQITTNIDNIKSVHCGGYYTSILKNDSTLWGCGQNGGELGLGDIINRSIFTIIGINTNDIESIYCGYCYTLILKNDGTLWGCGDNSYGELGLGDKDNRNIFTQITTNVNDIKCFANNYYPNTSSTIKIYDLGIGYTETLDTNNFRNIPVDKFEKIKVLCANPVDTYLNCLISFDKKQTWKTFDGLNWNIISDISPENIILNGMELIKVSQLNKSKLIAGGFTGDLDFKIAMKTNDKTATSSVTKIYIEYK